MIERRRSRKRGRPKEVPGDLKSVNVVVEIGRFKEFKELCDEEGVTISEGIRQLIEHEVVRKNQVGPVNPIKVNYERENKVMSLLHYLQETIDVNTISEECSRIDDQKTLAKLKGVAYTINHCADQQSMLLRSRGVKT